MGGPAKPNVATPHVAAPEEDPLHRAWDEKRTRYVIWKAVAQSKASSIGYTLLGLSVSLVMFVILVRYQHQVSSLGGWGYPGVMLVELANSATLFLPTPGHAYTFAVAGSLNPLLIAVLAGLGATIGELSGYGLGATGRQVIAQGRLYRRMNQMSPKTFGRMLFIVAALPVPFDFAGIWAGAIRYPVSRFLWAVYGGKVLKMLGIALIAYYLMS